MKLLLLALALAGATQAAGAPIGRRADAPATPAPIMWPAFVGPVHFVPAQDGLSAPEAGKAIDKNGGHGRHGHKGKHHRRD
ncbi:hypothetical protein Q8F55_002960 [Vanrija albida]|uniref:Uncharacterized protein n=1 Tax=Vanrija albida TaxID=181172 RepID=A0ABR3QBS9_9TREE